MQGCNGIYKSSFTNEDLDNLEGLEKGSFIYWRNELCRITEVEPLEVHPIWDL